MKRYIYIYFHAIPFLFNILFFFLLKKQESKLHGSVIPWVSTDSPLALQVNFNSKANSAIGDVNNGKGREDTILQ